MADSDGGVSSWPGFVDQLNKTFMLIRDAFGYALPGAVFLGIGVISGAFSMSRVSALLSPYTLPAWLAFFSAIVILIRRWRCACRRGVFTIHGDEIFFLVLEPPLAAPRK